MAAKRSSGCSTRNVAPSSELNEVRLDRYVEAAARWGAEWSRVSKEMAGRPLTDAHEIMVEAAAAHLPREP
jgi:hypothetical protein